MHGVTTLPCKFCYALSFFLETPQALNLARLIDHRFSGEARGVGTGKITLIDVAFIDS
jgi:hypothetical protein